PTSLLGQGSHFPEQTYRICPACAVPARACSLNDSCLPSLGALRLALEEIDEIRRNLAPLFLEGRDNVIRLRFWVLPKVLPNELRLVDALRSGQSQSSFRMVPVPRFLVNSALLLSPNRSRENVSSASFLLSPLTSMVMVFVVSPGAKVSVPVLAR